MSAEINKIDDRMAMFDRYLDRTNMDHKQYQYDGVRWILNNELRTDPVCGVRGGFIADEMGLGKTIMMIGTMLCNFVEKTLIVVPPVLLDQWYVQIYRTTGNRAIVFHGHDKKNIGLEQLNNASYRYEKSFSTNVYENKRFVGSNYSAFVRKRDNLKNNYEFSFEKAAQELVQKKLVKEVHITNDFSNLSLISYDELFEELNNLINVNRSIFLKHPL